MCKREKTEPRGTHEVYLRKRWVPGADGNILSAKYGAAWARAGPQLDGKKTGRSEAWFWAVAGLSGAATTPEILGIDHIFQGFAILADSCDFGCDSLESGVSVRLHPPEKQQLNQRSSHKKIGIPTVFYFH